MKDLFIPATRSGRMSPLVSSFASLGFFSPLLLSSGMQLFATFPTSNDFSSAVHPWILIGVICAIFLSSCFSAMLLARTGQLVDLSSHLYLNRSLVPAPATRTARFLHLSSPYFSSPPPDFVGLMIPVSGSFFDPTSYTLPRAVNPMGVHLLFCHIPSLACPVVFLPPFARSARHCRRPFH